MTGYMRNSLDSQDEDIYKPGHVEYILGEKIGKGNFEIRECTRESDGTTLAVKIITKRKHKRYSKGILSYIIKSSQEEQC
jgi:hypothetical protein